MNGFQVRTRRDFYDMKQWQLAAKIGVSATALNYYERGHRPIPNDVQERLKKIFGELEAERAKTSNVRQ